MPHTSSMQPNSNSHLLSGCYSCSAQVSAKKGAQSTPRIAHARACKVYGIAPTALKATNQPHFGGKQHVLCSRTLTYRRDKQDPHRKGKFLCSAQTATEGSRTETVRALMEAVEGTDRGVSTTAEQKQQILAAVSALQQLGKGSITTKGPISATWKLIWTTEKETLFILKNAHWFGTDASHVYQVIDIPSSRLQNVITFKNDASFVVDSSLEEAGEQRLQFRFTAARLNLPTRTFKIPPFGKGWFDTVYLDDDIRVAKDIRGDTLVVKRDGQPRTF